MKLWRLEVWHPECPGTRIVVWRNRLQRWLYPSKFGTLGEAIAYSQGRAP